MAGGEQLQQQIWDARYDLLRLQGPTDSAEEPIENSFIGHKYMDNEHEEI